MVGTTPKARARRSAQPHAAVAALVAGALALSACGGSGGEPRALAAAPVTTAPITEAPTTTTAPTTTLAATTTTNAAATTTSSTSTTTTSTTTTSTLPRQITTPIAPPLDTRTAEPVIEMGRIAIPEIGVDSVMYEGIRLSTLDFGPGHWPGSAMPGQIGNVVVAGHRTSKHQVFRHLDDLAVGSQILFSDANGDHAYSVTSVEIVGPDAIWIVDPTDTPTLTLFACHPPGSTAQRIVVHADLIV